MKNRQIPLYIHFIVMIVIISTFYLSIDRIGNKTATDRLNMLESIIRKAAVQCYAIEGGYPPNIKYLEEHYGIILDRNKYFYHYEAFASNIMPIVKVFVKNK